MARSKFLMQESDGAYKEFNQPSGKEEEAGTGWRGYGEQHHPIAVAKNLWCGLGGADDEGTKECKCATGGQQNL